MKRLLIRATVIFGVLLLCWSSTVLLVFILSIYPQAVAGLVFAAGLVGGPIAAVIVALRVERYLRQKCPEGGCHDWRFVEGPGPCRNGDLYECHKCGTDAVVWAKEDRLDNYISPLG